jgi:hypothetical protein
MNKSFGEKCCNDFDQKQAGNETKTQIFLAQFKKIAYLKIRLNHVRIKNGHTDIEKKKIFLISVLA